MIVVPYSKGLSESLENVYGKAGVQVHFKGSNTIKDLLIAPKGRDSITDKGGSSTDTCVTIQDAQWSTLVKLVGPLETDTRNILEPPIYDPAKTTGHSPKPDSFSIV